MRLRSKRGTLPALGTLLLCLGAPHSVQAASPYGWLDVATASRVAGWVKDPDFQGPVNVHIYVDGRILRGVLADSYRQDGNIGNHGFDISISPPLECGSHRVEVFAIGVDPQGRPDGVNPPLSGSPKTDIQGNCPAPPYGWLDVAASDRVAGWAKDPDYDGPIQVNIYSDGGYAGSVLADQVSSDVGAHRFSWTPPAYGPGNHLVRVYAIGVDAAGNADRQTSELSGSPKSFTITESAWQTSPELFDWTFYILNHPDLVRAGIDTEAEAISHWVNNGLREGREASRWFDPRQYLETYPDLRAAFGQDFTAAARHYLSYGIREGRLGAPFDRSVFDWQFYVNNYSDLRTLGFGEREARAHWVRYGIGEGRQGCYGFHTRQYLENYVDLRNAYGSNYVEALRHWQRSGIRQGRAGTSRGVPFERVGIFYLAWHGLAASAQTYAQERSLQPLNVNDVLTGRYGTRTLDDILTRPGLLAHAWWFHYQAQPALGYYCLYRKRPGEGAYEIGGLPVKDCEDTARVARTHADQLVSAGIDHVVLDSTNLSDFNAYSDVLQLRPIEVLFEEWRAYRATGAPTPAIAVWAAIPPGATLWQRYLDLYNDPQNAELVLRDFSTGKKVFFAVDRVGMQADSNIVDQISCNWNGSACRNDVLVVRMWGGTQAQLTNGLWSWLSPCTNGTGASTTTITRGTVCNQPFTVGSPLGSAIAASASYQVHYASLPNGSPGSRHGLTLKKMFERAFALHPDYVFIAGWNEFIAQPQNNRATPDGFPFYRDPAAYSLGFEGVEDGFLNGSWLFVDDYGAGFSRDIEPTVENGSQLYDITASCLRVYRRGRKACDVSGEACCDVTDDLIPLWSLRSGLGTDMVVTASASEKQTLVGVGFREICSRFPGSSLFCTDRAEGELYAGPFSGSSVPLPGGKVLWRCLRFGSSRHFLSDQADCEGHRLEGPLAYLAVGPTGEFPRALWRCDQAGTEVSTHSLLGSCPAGYTGRSLGYVR